MILTVLRQWVLEILDELQQLQVRKNSFIYNIASWPKWTLLHVISTLVLWSFTIRNVTRPSQRATSRVMEPTGKVPWSFVMSCRTGAHEVWKPRQTVINHHILNHCRMARTYSFEDLLLTKWMFFDIYQYWYRKCVKLSELFDLLGHSGGYEYGWLVYIQFKHQCMWQCKAMETRLEFDPCPSRSAIEAAVDYLQYCYLSMRKPMVDSEGNFGGSRQIGFGERCDSVWTQVSSIFFVFVTCFQAVWKGSFASRDGKLFWYSRYQSDCSFWMDISDISNSSSKKGSTSPKRENQENSIHFGQSLQRLPFTRKQVITFNASIKACGPCPGCSWRENQRSWSRMDLLRVLTLSQCFICK